MIDIEMEGRKNIKPKQIFRELSEKNDSPIYLDNPNFHEHNYVQGTNIYQSLKENLTNITFLGKKETSVTAAIIISKSFKLNHAR